MNAQDILQWSDPYRLFAQWYSEIQNHPLVTEPTAMTLATCSTAAVPSVRTVLLKQFSPTTGFIFFTNYKSRKGQDLTTNPSASLLFYWQPLFRQITVTGSVTRTTRDESEAYWRSRPRESQLAGWVSQQSRPVPSAQRLEEIYAAAERQWQNQEIPCPEQWGGFAVQPFEFEFWLGHRHRLHDRVRFSRQAQSWSGQQLFP
jgi:pyridoxamine 5'-phosphate oxidase